MTRRRIAIVFGGRSAEHEISCISARSVVEALDPTRFEVVPIGVDKDGRWLRLPSVPALAGAEAPLPFVAGDAGPGIALSQEPGDARLVPTDGSGGDEPFDVVFPLIHGPHGEDGTIQGLLEMADVPYVGAGVLGSAVGMDKAIQKVLLEADGIAVVPYSVVHERDWRDDPEAATAQGEAHGYPVFVKPANLGSSVGITKVHDAAEFEPAMEEAFRYDVKVVIEKGLEGIREIECAVLGNDEPVASLPGEVVPSGEFYDYRAKYLDESSELHIPADLPTGVVDDVQRMAVRAFQAIDCAGMARVDFFLGNGGELWVNELNTIPGFTSISMYPKLWEASGVPYAELLERLIDLAVDRSERERKKGRTLPAP
ncbi:MAG: D-alanine--D-alanine ligase family protein [Actinomycetota bacterium]